MDVLDLEVFILKCQAVSILGNRCADFIESGLSHAYFVLLLSHLQKSIDVGHGVLVWHGYNVVEDSGGEFLNPILEAVD